jgi:hypothetical protein
MSFRKSSHFFISSLLIFILGFVGCQKEGPTAPSSKVQVTKTTKQIVFLKRPNNSSKKKIIAEKFISATKGGSITVGNEFSGYSSIHIKPGDISLGTMIKFGWNPNSYTTELSPDGLKFNYPVKIILSYRDADLRNILENKLKIWYHNEIENVWEFTGGEVNEIERNVTGYIHHFSRYAVGEDD